MMPPRLARLLILLVVPASERDFFLGDLLEEFQQRVRSEGLRQANAWYWQQALRAPGWWRRTSPEFAPAGAELKRGEVMQGIVQDIRYALRSLRKNRSLVIFALGALALGIGANTAVYSVVRGILLKPLPYAEPERVLRLWDSIPPTTTVAVAPGNFAAWEKQNTVFAALGAYREDGFSLSSDAAPERVAGARITAGMLPVLGVAPVIGRWFTAEEDRAGAEPIVLLGNNLWKRRFGGDRNIIGKQVRVDGELRSVVGVMPPDFRFPIDGGELWIPYALDPANTDRSSHFLRVLARLKPGVPIETARAEMDGIAARLDQIDSSSMRKGWHVLVLPLRASITGDVGPTLWLLLGTVGLVLMIASANVANLLLARSVARRKEIALRFSLGASRSRLLRQGLIESLMLSIGGGFIGTGLATLGIDVLKNGAPGSIPRLADVSIDPSVLVYTVVVSIVNGLLFGILPAMRGSKLDLNESLKSASHGSTTGRHDHRIGRLLAASQIAIAMVVVISSGLMIRTLWKLNTIDPGFQTGGRLTFGINLNSPKYSHSPARAAFVSEVIDKLRTLPAVKGVGATHRLPMMGNSILGIDIEGQPVPPSGQRVSVVYRMITPDYFSVMGIPMVQGRTFDSRDPQLDAAVVVNQRMAARFWPGENPVGKRIRSGPQSPWLSVVGVAADTKDNRLDTDGPIAMYRPYSSDPFPSMTLVVHSTTEPTAVAGAIREEIRKLDPDLGITGMTPLSDVVASSIGERSFTAALLGVFAGMALLLATGGIYGVLAYAVNQRTREIGVRIALGANRTMVLKQIIADGMRLIVPGVLAGALGALAATRLLTALLFGVTKYDPATFATTTAFLIFVGLLACYVPARRAASVDPIVTLRDE